MKMDRVLVICAHPDDETLGLGGTIVKHSKKGDRIFCLTFADGETARNVSITNIKKRQKQAIAAYKLLGINDYDFLGYPDQSLDKIRLLELAQKIEKLLKKWKPNIVYTHFNGDVNQDHQQVFEATLIATRPIPNSKIKRLICYETPSSTEWGTEKFTPNLFVDIDKYLKTKLKAFNKYKGEVNTFPHPRSKESLIVRAKYWGTTVGLRNAEALLILREIAKK